MPQEETSVRRYRVHFSETGKDELKCCNEIDDNETVNAIDVTRKKDPHDLNLLKSWRKK